MAKASRRAAQRRVKSSAQPLPPIVFAHASVHSIGGASLFASSGGITNQNVQNYYSDGSLAALAVLKLQKAGFTIYGIDPVTISIGAPAEVYEKAFGTSLYTEEKPVIKQFGKKSEATFVLPADGPREGTIPTNKTPFSDVLEGVSINEPVYWMNKPFAPPEPYWHLEVPAGVSLGLNADPAHRMGITGRGVNTMMVDTGWYAHPYFQRRAYRYAPVVTGPGAINPLHDEVGHGTGESANLFAVAPDVNFRMVKMSNVDAAGAFNAAVALSPQIISCSWGSSKQNGPLSGSDLVLSAAIAHAVSSGITVIFSAGNGHWGFPGQHPDVISAGGAYLDYNMKLSASNYSSGFASNIYAGRKVPDVCGLVGVLPKAAYIMLPVEPGDQLDTQMSVGSFPNGDQTAGNDGWASFSGTSAAAPQIAGVCALIKQVNPSLPPATIRKILMQTAIDVTVGNCSAATGGNPAVPGPDLATGYGLVNAFAAVRLAATL